jgi:hypothetical protein
MRLSRFRILKTVGGTTDTVFAEITVETGRWLWKKEQSRVIFKDSLYWRFLDTGEFTPGTEVESMHSACKANALFERAQ